MNMKKLLFILALGILPALTFAQGAGGQIKRPIKKQQTTNTTPKKESEHQSARNSKLPPVIQNLVNNMVRVEGGTFTMGNDADVEAKPAHQVTLSSFSIGKYEVTQEEWEAVMGNNPSNIKGAKRPVENVNWNDCRQFIRKLRSLTGKNFRMLTEAEWEYAARGGNKSRGYNYSGSNILDDVGWYDGNSSKTTHDVGLLDPNELGLYDMSGNVWEWCADWYGGSYESGAQRNPAGPSSGSCRVIRGGGWLINARYCRSSYRYYSAPGNRNDDLGLRLVLIP